MKSLLTSGHVGGLETIPLTTGCEIASFTSRIVAKAIGRADFAQLMFEYPESRKKPQPVEHDKLILREQRKFHRLKSTLEMVRAWNVGKNDDKLVKKIVLKLAVRLRNRI